MKKCFPGQQEQVDFEILISDIAFMLLKVTEGGFADKIETALKLLLEFFDCDRCGFIKVYKDNETPVSRIIYSAYREGIEKVSPDRKSIALHPWVYQQLQQNKTIKISRMSDFPCEAFKDRQSFEAIGVKSVMDIPILIEGKVNYFLVFNALRRENSWAKANIPRLKLLGSIFATVFE